MSPEPVLQSRSTALPTVMSPEPLMILERPMSALIEMSAEPVLITNVSPSGTPRRRWAFACQGNLRKADPQPVVFMPDLYRLAELVVGSIDRGLNKILPGAGLHGDRSAAEVVHDNMPNALVGFRDAHRTHP